MPWLVRGDDVLAAAEVAVTHKARTRGLMGRAKLDGVFVIRPCRQVHTFGVEFPIDVAFCDRYGFVLHLASLKPKRVSRPVWRSYFAIEAPGGAFERWGLGLGDVVEVRG